MNANMEMSAGKQQEGVWTPQSFPPAQMPEVWQDKTCSQTASAQKGAS
jgi:hypothetical protein